MEAMIHYYVHKMLSVYYFFQHPTFLGRPYSLTSAGNRAVLINILRDFLRPSTQILGYFFLKIGHYCFDPHFYYFIIRVPKFHGGEYDHVGLLSYNLKCILRWTPEFRRNILPPSLRLNILPPLSEMKMVAVCSVETLVAYVPRKFTRLYYPEDKQRQSQN